MRTVALLFLSIAAFGSLESSAQPVLVSPDSSRFQVNGAVEMQIRALAEDFQTDRAYLSQWAWILNLESELDIAPDGWGPFDAISAFARIEMRYECLWTGCGAANTWRHFGDRATRAPARNWANAGNERFVGGIDLEAQGVPRGRVHSDNLNLLDISNTPRFDLVYDVGISRSGILETLGPLADDLFTFKRIDGPRESLAFPLGPWHPSSEIDPIGSLAEKESFVIPLPLRPQTSSLFTPSAELRRKEADFDSFDQNFRESELALNHGGSQDEWELKELYLDLDLLDGRLWVRAGKQNIVWGKTELFRTTDQFNPVDIALASLPGLEESRIALWSVRGVWSFWDVGPVRDLRVELAANFDDFEPIDTGRCGEPYTVWIVCGKTTALWAHGVLGGGLAGEQHPPDPWENIGGLEGGVRVEFRWNRFSFAITDFYGFDDIPSIELFNTYERKVDPLTGRPLDSRGQPLTPGNALEFASGNRQSFDFGCRAARGFGENALLALTGGMGTIPDLSQRCIPDVLNETNPVTLVTAVASLSSTIPNVAGATLSGQLAGDLVIEGALNGLDAAIAILGALPNHLADLNRDALDGVHGGGTFGTDCPVAMLLGAILCPIVSDDNLSFYLSDEQEALLGCGPFYLTDCDVDGIDVFNSEASVLLQSFPGFENNPIATRFVNGRVLILPGARGPADVGYDPSVDGTPPAGFANEMAAVSSNLAKTIGVLGIAEGDTGCQLDDLATCAAIRLVVGLSGSQRPELRSGGNGSYGRRDWGWHGGGEAQITYPKRNVLGFATDFTEDLTKTSWGFEFTWLHKAPFASNTSADLLQKRDLLNLTISVDRPTFVNFLNANRTFFLNSQVFIRYVPDYNRSFDINGPVSVLATFAIATGYFQDRLLPAFVFVQDFRSNSGGVLAQLTYRPNSVFSITFGVIGLHGKPQDNRIPRVPLQLFDTQSTFDVGTRFEGLSAIAERDELFLTLRYTF